MTWIIVNIATEGVTVGTLPKAIIGGDIEVLDTTKVGIVLDFTDGICTGGLDPEIDCTGEPDFIFPFVSMVFHLNLDMNYTLYVTVGPFRLDAFHIFKLPMVTDFQTE